MLGYKENTAPLCEKESKKIRAAAFRMATGDLNDEDLKSVKHFSEIGNASKYQFVWK